MVARPLPELLERPVSEATGPRGVHTVARRPLLLVPGWSDRAQRMRPLARALEARGWPGAWLERVEFADRFGSNRAHAAEIAAAAATLLAKTGEREFDIVAHSMGGLAARLFLSGSYGTPAARVRRVVFLGTPHDGTWAAWFAWGEGGREMRPGSRLLRELRQAGAAFAGGTADVPWSCIRAGVELRVFPTASALLAGSRDGGSVLCTHAGMLRSRRVAARVAAELLRR